MLTNLIATLVVTVSTNWVSLDSSIYYYPGDNLVDVELLKSVTLEPGIAVSWKGKDFPTIRLHPTYCSFIDLYTNVQASLETFVATNWAPVHYSGDPYQEDLAQNGCITSNTVAVINVGGFIRCRMVVESVVIGRDSRPVSTPPRNVVKKTAVKVAAYFTVLLIAIALVIGYGPPFRRGIK